jgi:hypothetical protein
MRLPLTTALPTGIALRPALPSGRGGLQHLPVVVTSLPTAFGIVLVLGLAAMVFWSHRAGLADLVGQVIESRKVGLVA